MGLPRPAVAAISMSTSQRWFASSGEHKDSADTAGTGASSNGKNTAAEAYICTCSGTLLMSAC